MYLFYPSFLFLLPFLFLLQEEITRTAKRYQAIAVTSTTQKGIEINRMYNMDVYKIYFVVVLEIEQDRRNVMKLTFVENQIQAIRSSLS